MWIVLWFRSLGYGDVFWKTLSLQWGIFTAFAATSFLILYGSFLVLKRAHLADLPGGHTILIGGQPVKLPVEPCAASHRAWRLARHCRCNRRRHDGGVADACALLVRAPPYWWYGGPNFWEATELLSLRPSCVAAYRRLAAYAQP